MAAKRKDWSNRKSFAVGLIVTALSIVVALSARTLVGYALAAILFLSGVILLLLDRQLFQAWAIPFVRKELWARRGALSELDWNLYVGLRTIGETIEQAKVEFKDEPSAKSTLNKIIAGYNAAQSTYKIYHKSLEEGGLPQALTSAQAEIEALKTDLSDLRRAFRGRGKEGGGE